MVKAGYGIDSHDVSIGANILVEAALADSFVTASGLNYDNGFETVPVNSSGCDG